MFNYFFLLCYRTLQLYIKDATYTSNDGSQAITMLYAY